MQLNRDQVLGEYRIVEPIGAGGMGEVYRAHDARLDRDVALKVLPDAVARDPHAQARFEREAKAIAALSHPNILAVYDYGSVEGTWYVVTELLEGETLRQRLAEGAIAPRKAAELGQQIARGLAAAHDKGIVHRDLKPENVFVTRDGRVKILDFGLAAAEGASVKDQDEATRTHLTAPGTVLGTVGYMSPEQVRGEPVDARSDIFSFGAVLYEMLGGARPFQRDTPAETMTAILKEEPPELASVSAAVPPPLATLIRRCLEKRPSERFQSAHDLAFSLEALSTSTVSSGAIPSVTGVGERRPRPSLAWTLGWGVAGVLLGAAAVALLVRPEPIEPPTVRILSARRGVVTGGRFLPGGQAAVYSATWEGEPREVFTATASSAARAMSFPGADLLSVSSTGELALALDRRLTLGWEAIGTLAVATAQGSAPRAVLEDVLVADWSPDGESLAVAHEVDGVVRLEYPIGTVLYESPGWISDLRVHPDGDRVAIADNPVRGDNVSFIRIVDRQGNVEDLGLGASWGMAWAPGGEEILHATGGTLFAVRPGGERRAIYAAPSSIRILDVDASGNLLVASASIQRELFGRAPGKAAERNLSWLDWTTPRALLPDGRTVVFEEGNQTSVDGYAIYTRGTDGSAPVPIGDGSVVAASPDGRWLVVVLDAFGDEPRAVLMPTGPGTTRPLTELGELRIRPRAAAWVPGSGSGDGAGTIVFSAAAPDGPTRLYRLALSGDAAPQPITPEGYPLAAQGVVVSPDGSEVVVLPVAGPAARFPIEGGEPRPVPGLDDGEIPLRFDRDGRHLYAQVTTTIPSPIVRVNVETGEREPWLELAPIDRAGIFTADYVQISDDGAAYVYSSRRLISRLCWIGGLR